jgi:pyruvate dehydrogenase E1 component
MPNEQYQGLFGASEEIARETLLAGLEAAERERFARALAPYDGGIRRLVAGLGGHDLGDILEALARARAERTRPTVIFAYTIKGYGLAIAARPQNHSALLTGDQIDAFRAECGLTTETEWDPFEPESPEGRLCSSAARRLERGDRPPAPRVDIPTSLSERDPPRVSTQAAFGRILLDLSRVDGLAERVVTVSPDVSVSTNLGGWINKAGVWGPEEEPVYDPMEDSPLRWRVGPSGRHIEVGIAEMNLVLLLGQLGLSWDFQRERLFPIGTLYDPFVMRALEGIVYSTYSGSRFVLAGTPSGLSLSREGGAHQSLNTPGIGIETPGLTYAEPCYARELEWLLLDGLARMQEPDGEALYLRLSTKPIEQRPFADVVSRRGAEAVRADVVAGGFRLREPTGGDVRVLVATCGAMVPEGLAAAEALAAEEGVAATVIVCSSPDRLYRDWRAARIRPLETGDAPSPSHLDRLVLPEERGAPVVTLVDGHSHALAWLGSALGVRCVPLGVDRFGQTGSQPALYAAYGVSLEAIVTAALVALG